MIDTELKHHYVLVLKSSRLNKWSIRVLYNHYGAMRRKCLEALRWCSWPLTLNSQQNNHPHGPACTFSSFSMSWLLNYGLLYCISLSKFTGVIKRTRPFLWTPRMMKRRRIEEKNENNKNHLGVRDSPAFPRTNFSPPSLPLDFVFVYIANRDGHDLFIMFAFCKIIFNLSYSHWWACSPGWCTGAWIYLCLFISMLLIKNVFH